MSFWVFTFHLGVGLFGAYTGAFWAAVALALAWAFSAGSLVAGLPGVEYTWFSVGCEGPVGLRLSDMVD